MCSESTSGLGQEKLARLLTIGSDEDHVAAEDNGTATDQDKADLLREMLRTAIPVDDSQAESLPDIIRRACVGLRPSMAEPEACVLADPGVGLGTIQRIKDGAKVLAKSAKSDLHCEVATVVYYAAIASALVFHDTAITKITRDKLCQSFDMLESKTWLPRDIADLLGKASEICGAKTPRDK